jgi:hypothetical protein
VNVLDEFNDFHLHAISHLFQTFKLMHILVLLNVEDFLDVTTFPGFEDFLNT